jgi:hypothetical protein
MRKFKELGFKFEMFTVYIPEVKRGEYRIDEDTNTGNAQLDDLISLGDLAHIIIRGFLDKND